MAEAQIIAFPSTLGGRDQQPTQQLVALAKSEMRTIAADLAARLAVMDRAGVFSQQGEPVRSELSDLIKMVEDLGRRLV